MLPEFRVIKYNYKEAKKAFEQEEGVLKELSEIFNKEGIIQDIENIPLVFEEWLKTDNGKKFKLDTPIIEKIEYNFNKEPKDNSRQARNNLLLDLMTGVLTNSDTTFKMLNPGGFDPQKKVAKISAILSKISEKQLEKELFKNNIELNKTIKRKDKVIEAPIISYLFDLPLSIDPKIKEKLRKEGKPCIDLDELALKFKSKIDPLSPWTQIYFHNQNMTGDKMIGIYANHNANHALMQHTDLALDIENGAFTLNGKKLTSLHDIKNDENEFISRNNAGFLAASVDNVKDPVLAYLNQNEFTADASMLLSRLGYTTLEIGLLMNQPIIKEFTKLYFKEQGNKSKDAIIDEIIQKYKKNYSNFRLITSYDSIKGNQFYIEDLAENIVISNEMRDLNSSKDTDDFRKVEYYKNQISVGYLFIRIMKSADALGALVQATRIDTQNGAAGPTIADSITKIQKLKDFIIDSQSENFPLIETDIITNSIKYSKDIKHLRKQLLDSKLPFLQAFYTLGLQFTSKFLNTLFPQYSNSFMDVINALRRRTKLGKLDVKTMNSVYNDLITYAMTDLEFFYSTPDWNVKDYKGNSIEINNYKDIQNAFTKYFLNYFTEVINKNPDIASNEFIKRLKLIKSNEKCPAPTLVFKNVGSLNPILREKFMNDWASLMYSENPEARKLAFNLVRYCFHRNGLSFGPNTFGHLIPTVVRLSIPGYKKRLESLLTNEEDFSPFIDQYILNHLNNKKLVPEISNESTILFTTENGSIRDSFSITINNNSSYADKKITREITKNNDEVIDCDFFEYISFRKGTEMVYYGLRNSWGNSAEYERITPLGSLNNFIQYEYGKFVSEITPMFTNDENAEKNKEDEFKKYILEQQHEEYEPRENIISLQGDTLSAYDEIYGADYINQLKQATEYSADPVIGADNIPDC